MLREIYNENNDENYVIQTYICCDAVELLSNGEEAARRAIQ